MIVEAVMLSIALVAFAILYTLGRHLHKQFFDDFQTKR